MVGAGSLAEMRAGWRLVQLRTSTNEGLETSNIFVRRELRDDGNHRCDFYFVREHMCVR